MDSSIRTETIISIASIIVTILLWIFIFLPMLIGDDEKLEKHAKGTKRILSKTPHLIKVCFSRVDRYKARKTEIEKRIQIFQILLEDPEIKTTFFIQMAFTLIRLIFVLFIYLILTYVIYEPTLTSWKSIAYAVQNHPDMFSEFMKLIADYILPIYFIFFILILPFSIIIAVGKEIEHIYKIVVESSDIENTLEKLEQKKAFLQSKIDKLLITDKK